MSTFETLNVVNVNNHVEKKKDLTYLSWPWAWAEVKSRYPDANYKVHKYELDRDYAHGDNTKLVPYMYDGDTGYLVTTEVTIDGITHEMWLPVMDASNKAMKNEPYTYDTKYKKGIRVEAASMFDINKTIMRCLVKNLAMFGLGLYIYAGEDLPEDEQQQVTQQAQQQVKPAKPEWYDDKVKQLSDGCARLAQYIDMPLAEIKREWWNKVNGQPLEVWEQTINELAALCMHYYAQNTGMEG